jgi:hypothetical protein
VGRNLVITDNRQRTRPFPDRQIVILNSEVEGVPGSYNWTRDKGRGPETGVAKEVSATTGIAADTKVVLFKHGGEWWFQVGGGGSGASIFPAIILEKVSTYHFLIDIYAAGYSEPATITGVEAFVVDNSSQDFQEGNQVVCFAIGDTYYISTTRVWLFSTTEAVRFGRIVSHNGAGVYTITIHPDPDSAALPGTLTAKEMNGSQIVSPGMNVPVFYSPTTTTNWFWAPFGDCA